MKSLNPLKLLSFFIIVSAITSCSCGHKNALKKNETIDLDQEVTENGRPMDSVFLHFEKDWKKFINRSEILARPVNTGNETEWQPLIITDCVFSPELKIPVPQVDITWQEPSSDRSVRFDIALQYDGFKRNYYTTVLPADESKRFNIPGLSAFVQDTAAVLLIGPPMLPKVINFSQVAIKAGTTTGIADTGRLFQKEPGKPSEQTGLVQKSLRITELGLGLSYRIRMCTFDNEAWRPTKEVIFSTPICPND